MAASPRTATLNMYGGFIYNNEATGSSQGGGGVYAGLNSIFNFYGGIIYGADGLTQTHSPREAPNNSTTGRALSVGDGTARYGDGSTANTSDITIVGRQ